MSRQSPSPCSKVQVGEPNAERESLSRSSPVPDLNLAPDVNGFYVDSGEVKVYKRRNRHLGENTQVPDRNNRRRLNAEEEYVHKTILSPQRPPSESIFRGVGQNAEVGTQLTPGRRCIAVQKSDMLEKGYEDVHGDSHEELNLAPGETESNIKAGEVLVYRRRIRNRQRLDAIEENVNKSILSP